MNLYNYLLKHIDFDVDKQFIKQFYEIQKNKSRYNVDLDDVVKWLDVKSESMIDTLKLSYQENEDYVVKLNAKPKKKNLGGSEKKSYYVTSECFKLLALRSRAKNGEKIRKYYIKLEEIVNQYKNEILELYNQEQEIKKLNNKIYPRKPGIYIIRETKIINTNINKNNNNNKKYRYKLGRTNNLKERMAVYNTGSSDNVDLIYFEEILSHVIIERCIKFGLVQYAYKKNKEFYDCSLKKIKDMIISCIKFHDNKMFRPYRLTSYQMQFSYIKDKFDSNKIIHLELDKYDQQYEKSLNIYDDHWSSDNVDIFKTHNIYFETDDSSISEQIGGHKYNIIYRENKQAYKLLMNLENNNAD